MTADAKKNIYFENLDSLRAIAAFSVVFFHLSIWLKYPNTDFYNFLRFVFSFGGSGGSLGVVFFFILSGFLITYLLYVEQKEFTKINVAFFYVRRMLRIWPLYYLTLIIGFLIFPFIINILGQNQIETASIALYLSFMTNFDHIYNAYPTCGILGVQWSVAIEEQFYLLWPLLFYGFGKRKIFPAILFLIVFCSELFFAKSASETVRYYHLISNFRFLAFGGLLAYFAFLKNDLLLFFFNLLSKTTTLLIYTVSILLLLFQQKLIEIPLYNYFNHFLPFVFFGFVILEQNFSQNSFYKLGNIKLLKWMGKISYGLYLLHMVAIYIVISFLPNDPALVLFYIVLALVITIVLSFISYRYFESYFLKKKSLFKKVKQQNY